MAFKAAFVAHAPDADPEKNRCVVETPTYKLFVVLVSNQDQALDVCRGFVEEEGIHSVLLCPGFTNKDIADIQAAVGKDVGVNVARGDPPSTRIAVEVMAREWPSH
jgi:Family of unknown function (DUF6506)